MWIKLIKDSQLILLWDLIIQLTKYTNFVKINKNYIQRMKKNGMIVKSTVTNLIHLYYHHKRYNQKNQVIYSHRLKGLKKLKQS